MNLTIPQEDFDRLVEAVAARLNEMRPPDRVKPFSVAEVAEELGLSTTSVRRLVDDGKLLRVADVGRVLVPVEEVRRFQKGEGR